MSAVPDGPFRRRAHVGDEICRTSQNKPGHGGNQISWTVEAACLDKASPYSVKHLQQRAAVDSGCYTEMILPTATAGSLTPASRTSAFCGAPAGPCRAPTPLSPGDRTSC